MKCAENKGKSNITVEIHVKVKCNHWKYEPSDVLSFVRKSVQVSVIVKYYVVVSEWQFEYKQI